MSLIPFRRSKEDKRVEARVDSVLERIETAFTENYRRPSRSEANFGATGTVFYNGIIADEEYNPDLRWEKAVRKYDEMWRSDGAVQGITRACELPILEADWKINPASDSHEDVAVAQFVSDNLFGGMEQSWRQTLEEILTCLRFGYSVHEKLWKYDTSSGTYRIRKLGFRSQKTIWRWWEGPNDRLHEIEQRVYKISEGMVGTGQYTYIRIPAEKCLVFSYRRLGNNYEGISLLRSAYKHWYYKDQTYRIDAIANERHGLGVPFFEEPQTPSVDDRNRAAATLASLNAHERNYVLIPFGWKFGFANMNASSLKDPMPTIEHHTKMIARSILAEFLNHGETGSYARSISEVSLFLKSLMSIAKLIAEVINEGLIRELVDLNFNVERYPTLLVEELDQTKVTDLIATIPQLVSSGSLTAGGSLENWLRTILGLPDLPPEEAAGGEETVDSDSNAPGSNPEGGEESQLTQSPFLAGAEGSGTLLRISPSRLLHRRPSK